MDESGNQFRDVLSQICLSQVTISGCIVQTDVDSCLKEVILPDDRVEEGLHVDATVLISVELQEGRGAEEVPELKGQLRGNCQKRVVVQTFFVVVRGRNVLLKQLMQLFQLCIRVLVTLFV